jgi:hypothetical protein
LVSFGGHDGRTPEVLNSFSSFNYEVFLTYE